MHKLMPCSSQQIQQIQQMKKSVLHFKVSCRNTPARCDYIEAPGESAKESGLTQEATDPETPVSWQAGPKFDQAKRQRWQSALALARLTLSSLSLWCHERVPTLFYCCIDMHRLPEYCWQDLTRTNRPNDTWNIYLMDLDAVSWREWPWATKPTKPQASKKLQNACHHVVVVCFGSQQLAHRCFLISVSMSSNVI